MFDEKTSAIGLICHSNQQLLLDALALRLAKAIETLLKPEPSNSA